MLLTFFWGGSTLCTLDLKNGFVVPRFDAKSAVGKSVERFDFIGALVAGSGFVEDGRIQGKPDVMYFTVNTVNKNSVVLFFWIFFGSL